MGYLHQNIFVTDMAFTSDFCNNHSHPASSASLYLTSCVSVPNDVPKSIVSRPQVTSLRHTRPNVRPPVGASCPRPLVPGPSQFYTQSRLSIFYLIKTYVNIESEHRNKNVKTRGGSRIFFRRGCTRLLLYFNTNKLHSFFFFFCRIPAVLKKPHPLHPPPRSAPENYALLLI